MKSKLKQCTAILMIAIMTTLPTQIYGIEFSVEDPHVGTLEVVSDTDGELYMDGVHVGRVPKGRKATLNSVPVGEHELEMRYGEYTRRKTVTVRKDQTVDVNFEFALGSLKVTTEMEGKLYLNGEPAGNINPNKPLMLDKIITGTYKLEMHYAKGIDYKTVTVKKDSIISVQFYEPRDNSMIYVEGGSFTMGSPASESGRYDDEGPQHQVTVSSFYISKYEVTQRQWKAVMGSNPSVFEGHGRPVEEVSWYDAVKFCNALSRKEGRSPAYTVNGKNVSWNRNADGYRLPTEAEWEYAARGGKKSKGYVYSGGNTAGGVAWYSGISGRETQTVGTKRPNELGLYDMSGNVWEWCWDWYGDYSSGSQTDPEGPSIGSSRVLRGGSWYNIARGVRVANRFIFSPGSSDDNRGFRLVLPAI